MELVSSLKTLLGVLLVTAAMVLSLPGIEAVRAEEPVVDVSAPGPQCSQSGADLAREHAISLQIEVVQAAWRARQESDPVVQGSGPGDATPAHGVVVLNTRGYNHGSAARGSAANAPPAAPAR